MRVKRDVVWESTCIDPQENLNRPIAYHGTPTHMRIEGRKVPELKKGHDSHDTSLRHSIGTPPVMDLLSLGFRRANLNVLTAHAPHFDEACSSRLGSQPHKNKTALREERELGCMLLRKFGIRLRVGVAVICSIWV